MSLDGCLQFDMRLILIVIFLIVSGLLAAFPARAQSDWDALIAQLGQTNPDLVAQWETAKKDAEKNEKDLKSTSDRYFQSSFDAVFGKDKVKPSDGLEMMKIIEAASSGDIDYASKAGGELFIASYMPGLGQYIAVMKKAAEGIKAAEQMWIDGLNDTKAYQNFIEILYAQPTGRDPYIPSYMITYLRNNEQFGAQISVIYDDMRAREDQMFRQWVSDDAAMTQMLLPGWASRWISARGKVPTEREMFNYFLYNQVKNSKARYMERFVDEYIRPLIRQEARLQRQKLSAIMTSALIQISQDVQAEDQDSQSEDVDQCPTLLAAHRQSTQTVKQQERLTTAFYGQVLQTWKARRSAALNQEAEVQARRWAPLHQEEKSLAAERAQLEAKSEKLDAIVRRLEVLKGELERLQASYDASENDAAIARRGNAKLAVYNALQEAEYNPLKAELTAEGDDFNARQAAYNDRKKSMQEAPLDKSASTGLWRSTKATRDAIEAYQTNRSKCVMVSQAAVSDNLAGQLGLDPTAAIASCAAMMDAIQKSNALSEQYNGLDCGKK